jgi:uncharacterized protein
MVNSRQQNKKKFNFVLILIPVLIIIIVFIIYLLIKKPIYPQGIGLIIGKNDYFLEIAQTSQERKIGLSNRNELCSNCGMLFIFDKESNYPFWMKDTYIPLDIIWLNSEYKIVKIIHAVETNSETTYVNNDPAKYVIELKANEVLKLGLTVGDTIPLELTSHESKK